MSKNLLFFNTITRITPENTGLAVLVLLLFFAIKSLTLVFPLSVLYLSSGLLFSGPEAILVSITGFAITITIPYLIGRFFSEKTSEFILRKYPGIKNIISLQADNMFFVCFITRFSGLFPADILSLYFGMCRIPYKIHLLAGITGSLLSIITTTLLGSELENPASKEFIIVLMLRIVLTVISFFINSAISKKKNN